jgi:IS5 family transposase
MYFLANGFNLADEAGEEALYDVPLFRDLRRMDLGDEQTPDATTLLNFRSACPDLPDCSVFP